MSYIKIYPKCLSVSALEDKTFGGKVVFDIEQYGHLYPRESFDIRINKSAKNKDWQIISLEDHPDIKNFDSFLKALNYFIFHNLKVQLPDPTETSQRDPLEIELREVYFALDPTSPSASPNYRWGSVEQD